MQLRGLLVAAALSVSLAGPAAASPPTGWTSGGKSVLIIPVGFTDMPAPAGPPNGWTNHMAVDDAWFIKQSYSNYGFSSFAVCPPIAMGVSSTTYTPYVNWHASAFLPDIRAKAKLAGYDSDNFDLEIIHTWITSESARGIANTGGKGLWINFSNESDRITHVTGHEIGHNLGNFHCRGFSSASYIYPAKTGFWLADYGNPFDRMGFGLSMDSDFCAYTKNTLGWLPDSLVANAATSGTYRIHAFDQGSVATGNMYAMMIVRDQANNFWFEFRQSFTNVPWSMNGLHVFWGAEYVLSSAGAPRLLDMTPGSHGALYPDPIWKTGGATMFDAPLLVGRTFSDVNKDLHITPARFGGTTPESLDVVVNYGPFLGNQAPSLSISATTLSPATNQMVTFTAAASDPNGDTLAYFWEFDDPDAPGSSKIRPFGAGTQDPDATLRTSSSNTWASNGVYLVRCTATDMKGGRTIAAVTVTVGTGSGLTISGTVKDQLGAPVAGAVVNNWNLGTPAVQFGDTNFVASGETSTNGQYTIHVRGSTTYKLMARHAGHYFQCNTPGGSTTGTVSVVATSVTNVNFTRVTNTFTIGGTLYLEGIYPSYNPAIHGAFTVHDGNPAHDALVDSNGNWRMTLPEGPVSLSFTAPPGYTVRYGFPNPYEVMDDYVTLHLFVGITGVVSSVGFSSSGDAGDDTPGPVNIPVVLALPDGYTNSTWPPNLWLKGEVGSGSTAEFGVDYRFYGMEVRFTNFTAVFTNYLTINILSNGSLQSRTVTLNLVPLNSASHMGAITSYTYAIIPPGADADADTMPDAWEWHFAQDFTNIAPGTDSDGDGMNNLGEYAADTDPGDTNSVLAITSTEILAGNLRVDWKGGTGSWQYIECRTDPLDPLAPWTPIQTNLPPTATSSNLVTAISTNEVLHYRIRAQR